jgi:selenocysteine lyase/cysteine desulfurase
VNVHTSPVSSARLDFERYALPNEVVRASVHYYNTLEEVDVLVDAVART